ncbi:hypothetical protein B7R21_10700 [Subtercola boreus]|uniref:Uncharacterized protein n=1 Tax=Subtercola boreus TaxID=120213 RepID=A0A3E0VSC6_9MICO|nr:hypothetical protein [Subtercola boreus]RFA12786.1 hypothetical protein B7R21_10700 [Subtercola boreus]
MLTAVLLAAIGSADLWRSLFRGRRVGRISAGLLASIGASWVLLAVLVTTGLGVPLGWVALCLLAAGGWLALTTSDEHSTGRAGRAAVAVLIALVVILLLADRTGLTLSGYLVDGQRDAATAALRDAPLPQIALFFGVGLFLAESANIVVRIALHPRSRVSAATMPVDVDAGLHDDSSHNDSSHNDASQDSSARDEDLTRTDLTRTDLKGGRLIGPLERLLIVAIVLAGLAPIAAALVAAKGIVRFPEIAQDARGGDSLSGTKAEYFLVGSLVSWATAAGAIALLVAAR